MRVPSLAFACLITLTLAVPARAAVWTPPLRPEWTYDIHGRPSDLINLYVHSDLATLRESFLREGWIEAAPLGMKHDLEYLGAVLFPLWPLRFVRHAIQSMPLSILLRCGHPQVLSFEMHNHPWGGRQHFRVFFTGTSDSRGVPVWAIAASRDLRIKIDGKMRGSVFLSHKIQKNQDIERDLVMHSLDESGNVEAIRELLLERIAPSSFTGAYSQDRLVYDVILKSANR